MIVYKTLIAFAMTISSFYIGKELGEYVASPQIAACSNNLVKIQTRNGNQYELRIGKSLCLTPERNIYRCLEKCLDQ